MSTPSISGTRTCPECGTQNSGLSLFCTECGTPLAEGPAWSRPSDATQATAAIGPTQDPEATTAITPVTATPAQPDTDDAWASPNATVTWSASAPDPSAGTIAEAERPESRRGFVLGVIASILIAIVIGFVVWTSLFSEATRDMITGWFGWIG